MKCNQCNEEIQDGVKFCTNCGAPMAAEPLPQPEPALETETLPETVTAEAMPETVDVPLETAPAETALEPAAELPEPAQEQPQAATANPKLVGWSEKISAPEITKKASRRYKAAQFWARMLATLIIAGCCALGYFVPQIPLTYALIAGLVAAGIVLYINGRKTHAYTQPAWEGEVVDKKVLQRPNKSRDGNESEVYYLYKTFFRTTFGKKKSFVSEDVYTYLRIGDKVRFHPALQYFEKYDKSRDLNIYCCVCKTLNPIENDVCAKCKAPLIKP